MMVFYYAFYRFFHSIKKRSILSLIFNEFTITYSLMVAWGVWKHFDNVKHFVTPPFWIENVKKNCGTDDLISLDPETANF